jgi:hypothetical protein
VEPKAEAQKAEESIKYEILRHWTRGSIGEGMEIFVSPGNTKEVNLEFTGRNKKTS